MFQYLAHHNWLWWILIGFLAGAIAKAITPGRDPSGCLITIVLGIAGALVAGFLGQKLGWYGPGEGAGFIAAILGSVLLLIVYRLVAGRGR
jgi:uncharacterized membrane protein YeaQ/YmgE (transglycosylase-associated protein family)